MFLIALSTSTICYGQSDSRITTVSFVQILNDARDEAIFYYQNNWKILREWAMERSYIHSYQLLEAPYDEEAPFELILITTYSNQEQYDLREDHFGKLIEEKGGLNLMNDKQPNDFRKVLFNKEMVRHWK